MGDFYGPKYMFLREKIKRDFFVHKKQVSTIWVDTCLYIMYLN